MAAWERCDGNATFDVAITSGATVVGVNGEQFSPDKLDRSIAATARGEVVSLLVQDGSYQREVRLDHADGFGTHT